MRVPLPKMDPVSCSFSLDTTQPCRAGQWSRATKRHFGVHMWHRWAVVRRLVDFPHVFGCMTKFAAGNAGTEVKVADSDAVVLQVIGEIIATFGHGSNKDCDALILIEAPDVVAYAHNFRVEAERDLATVGWEMIGDGVLDDLDEFFLRRSRANLVAVEQLHHETRKALKCSGNAHRRADPDKHVLVRLDVDLEPAGFVDRRVEESKETLKRHVSGLERGIRGDRVYTPDG
jgi:hypothetical protein